MSDLSPYVADIQRITDYVRNIVSCFGAFDLDAEIADLTPEARLLCIELPALLAELKSHE